MALLGSGGCVVNSYPGGGGDLEALLNLRWFPAAEDADPDRGLGALAWALSDLGALPAEGEGISLASADSASVVYALSFDQLWPSDLHWNEGLGAVWREAESSDEYERFGSFDAGRFLMRTLYEPERYAAITGACATIDDWKEARQTDTEAYAVTSSMLTDGERIVVKNLDANSSGMLGFLATEGEGSLAAQTFVPGEQETVDLMDNGQFRYAVYDAAGNWIPGARSTPAGQPGKCIWCHEWQIQPGTSENASAPGYLSYSEWMERIAREQGLIEEHRASLSTAVPYDDVNYHEDAEQLVQNFLWPTPARVAAEWGWTEEDLAALVLPTYDVEEYGWTGRHSRADVDASWPDGVPVGVLTDNRELYDGDTLASAPLPPCAGR